MLLFNCCEKYIFLDLKNKKYSRLAITKYLAKIILKENKVMKQIISVMIFLTYFLAYSKSLDPQNSKKQLRTLNSAELNITGQKAEKLFQATLDANSNLSDSCTAHSCSFTAITKCDYNQFSENIEQTYVCTVTPKLQNPARRIRQ